MLKMKIPKGIPHLQESKPHEESSPYQKEHEKSKNQ